MGRIPTIFYCSYDGCSASFNRKHRYEAHLRSHTGERPFICSYDDCEKCFTNSCHLKRHEESHGSSLKCTYENCHVILKTKATLKKHIKLVHLKIKKHKVYSCTLCERQFKKHNTLQRHILRHTGELPFKCSVEGCDKAFDRPSRLERHNKVHKGYPCKRPDCDKVFEKWSLYIQHVKDSHPSEFKCDACGKIFSTSKALKLHSLIHEELRTVYDCQVPNCSRYYYFKRNLDYHMREYHAKRPYTCDKENCFKSYKTEADLARHIFSHNKRRKSRRKTKPKKPKPSFAAILAGCVKKGSNRKLSSITEPQEKLDVCSCSNESNTRTKEFNNTQTIPKLNSSNSYQKSQSKEFGVPVSFGDNKNNLESIDIVCWENYYKSSQSDSTESEITELLSKQNSLESSQSIEVEELNDSVCSSENDIESMQCEDNESLTELNICGYTNIEIVSEKNSSIYEIISVPVFNIVDDKYWKENVDSKDIVFRQTIH